jgi:hypothetical protein
LVRNIPHDCGYINSNPSTCYLYLAFFFMSVVIN